MSVSQDMTGENTHLLGCRSCGLVQRMPPLPVGYKASCRKCGAPLAEAPRSSLRPLLCWTITALLLSLPALLYPLFIVSAVGIVQQGTVPDAVRFLVADNYVPLAAAIAAFVLAVPVLWLGALTVVLFTLLGQRRPGWLGPLFRLVVTLDMWAMPEVFLLGGLIAYSRLIKVTTTHIGIGGWSYMLLAFVVMFVRAQFDRHHLWEEIEPASPLEDPDQAIICPDCALVTHARYEHSPCPRCGMRIIHRKPHAIGITTALVLASYLLYIPANLVPVLSVMRLGKETRSTILGGAVELIQSGLWPLALLVFIASIAIPVFKLFGLSWFLVSTRRHSRQNLVVRTRLYRIIEQIGRWSNIDVFMIALLDSLVRFGFLATIKPMPGALAFASVVLLTMIATNAFDSRLMWDAADKRST